MTGPSILIMGPYPERDMRELEALESGAIKGAAPDVFHNEPRIDTRFLKLSNTVLQPHHSSGTVETRKAMGQLVRDNLAAHFAGRPLLSEVV